MEPGILVIYQPSRLPVLILPGIILVTSGHSINIKQYFKSWVNLSPHFINIKIFSDMKLQMIIKSITSHIIAQHAQPTNKAHKSKLNDSMC